MILYVQNSKDFAKKLLEKKIRNNKLTEKSLGYKINIKNVTSLYTQNELVERQVKKTISFSIATKEQNT